MEKSKTLGVQQAMARFAVVSFTEIFALLACYAPLVRALEPWQRDCRELGFIASVVALLAMAIVPIVFFAIPKPKNKPVEILARQLNLLFEGGILIIYLLNVTILACVIIRTG